MRGLTQGCTAGLGHTQPSDLSISLGYLSAQPCNNPANVANKVFIVRPHLRWYFDYKTQTLFFFSSICKVFIIKSSMHVSRGSVGICAKGAVLC